MLQTSTRSDRLLAGRCTETIRRNSLLTNVTHLLLLGGRRSLTRLSTRHPSPSASPAPLTGADTHADEHRAETA